MSETPMTRNGVQLHLTSVVAGGEQAFREDEASRQARVGNVASVRRFLELLELPDIETWLMLWAEESQQEMPYAPPGFPGLFESKARIAEQFRALPATYEFMRYPDLEIFETQDPKVVIATFRGEIKLANSDRRYDNRYVNFFVFDDSGKLMRVVEHFNPLVLTQGGAFGEGGRPLGAGE